MKTKTWVGTFQREKARIGGLVERLRRTSFRDRTEREMLVAELHRAMARFPSERRARPDDVACDPALLEDSSEAVAAARRACGALAIHDAADAFAWRLARFEDGLSRALAAEEDLIDAAAGAAAGA